MKLIVAYNYCMPQDRKMFWAMFLPKLLSTLLKTVLERKMDYLDGSIFQ